MNLFLPKLRNVWKDWELRVLVLLSLTLQTILIILGNRRKYTSRSWIRILLWCAYLTADWVATVALGVISNNLRDVMQSIGKDGLNESIQLTAFWAPFLLLHLGGPDTITAYSLEDNELWLRHLLGLGVQIGVALYIFLVAWTGSYLSILSILIFCAGIIKYGERTWALRLASNEQLRDSMLIPPEPNPNYSKFMREYTLKKFDGFHVKASHVIEAQVVHIPVVENDSIPDATELVKAYDLFQIFKRLLVDLILRFDDRKKSHHMFSGIRLDEIFKVIEMELGLMYDMLYTKATLTHSFLGCGLRILSFSFTSISLALFTVINVINVHKYSNIDLVLTFLLLSVAILLEIYAFLLLLSSDTTDIWLSRRATTSVHRAIIHKAITCLQLPKQPRWSNSMSQFNLLSFAVKDKHTVFYGILKCLHIDKVLEKTWYTSHEKVPRELKKLIIRHFYESFKLPEEESDDASNIKTLCSFKGGEVLKKRNYNELVWSVVVEFDQSILIWHVATDICYQLDQDPITFMLICKLSTLVSQYMLYLLVICPSMLPMGIGMIRFQDTCAEITHFFEAHKSIKDKSDSDKSLNTNSWSLGGFQTGESTFDKSHACEMLLKVITQVPPTEVERERNKSVLFDACKLASQLQAISDKKKKWELISNVWVEMLTYAACHCRGNHHAQQLRRGGELLTHVWLLMAHFGINEYFQTSQGHARAKLVAK